MPTLFVFSSFHVTNYGLKIEVNNSQKESLLTVEKESKEEVYERSSKKAMSWKKGAPEMSSGRWLLWSFQVPYPSFHVLHSVEMQKNSPLWRPDRISLSLPSLWPWCWLPLIPPVSAKPNWNMSDQVGTKSPPKSKSSHACWGVLIGLG